MKTQTLLLKLGMSSQEFAEAIGYDRSHVERVIKAKRPPSSVMFIKMQTYCKDKNVQISYEDFLPTENSHATQ